MPVVGGGFVFVSPAPGAVVVAWAEVTATPDDDDDVDAPGTGAAAAVTGINTAPPDDGVPVSPADLETAPGAFNTTVVFGALGFAPLTSDAFVFVAVVVDVEL